MKKIIAIVVLALVAAYAYYDEGIGPYRNNQFRFAYSEIGAQGGDAIDVSKKLISSNADVILISDWSGENVDPVGILSSGYKVVNDSSGKDVHGLLLFAKNNINITSMQVRNPVAGPCSRPILTASLQYNKTLITILGVYAPPPLKSCKYKTDNTVQYFSTLIKNGKLSKNIGVGKKGDEVIMAGDLNTLPFNKTIDEIKRRGLIDAYKSVGRFLGATWTPLYGLPKLARIDYLFISPNLDIKKMWNTSIPGGRHNLLVADFSLP